MRKSKEERVIEHGDYMLEELHRVYQEGIGIDEYYQLLKEYKRLYKRYEKMIKLSDNMGQNIMEKNDTLNDSLEYTIKTARSKLMDNVTEHRKTKEASSKYQSIIKDMESALKESYATNNKLKRELQSYIKYYGEMKNEFYDELKEFKSEKAIRNTQSIESVLKENIEKGQQDMLLLKVSLNDFKNMKEVILENSSLEKFLDGIYKYLKNSFQKEDTVLPYANEQFFILCKNRTFTELKNTLETLNKKRKILRFNIEFTIGATQFVANSDTLDSFKQRCEKAFDEAIVAKKQIIFK